MDVPPWQCLFPESFVPPNPIPSSSPPVPASDHASPLHHSPASCAHQPQKKSFAQALKNVCDIPMSQLPVPCLKGDELTIQIPKEEYIAGLESSKTNLHSRILLSKGDKPIKIDDMKTYFNFRV